MANDAGKCMLSVTTGSGYEPDSPVVYTAWVIPREMADDLIAGLRESLGPPQVESIGTLGGAVESYERSQREGTAVFFPSGEDANNA